MRRRAFITLAAVTPLAGCTDLLNRGGVDTTLSNDELVEFDADEGAELSVSVDVQEIFQPGDEDDDPSGEQTDAERDSVGFQIRHEDEGVLNTWSVEESETFDVTIEHGGTHTAMVMSGIADVTIE